MSVAQLERRNTDYDFDPHAPPPREMSFTVPSPNATEEDQEKANALRRLDTSALGFVMPGAGDSPTSSTVQPLTPGFIPPTPTVGGEKVGKTSPVLESAPLHTGLFRDRDREEGTNRSRSPRPTALSPRPNAGVFDPSRHPLPVSPTKPSSGMNPYDPPSLHSRKYYPDELSPVTPMPLSAPIVDEAQGQAKAGFYDSPAYWLIMYFCFNLGLTLFNKGVLVSFPFPYTLTGLHALSGCAGCYFALERGAFVPARLTSRENVVLGAFSVLYTINIAVSNISLQLVTVPFHQVVRASTPLFTILISAIFLRTKFSTAKLVSLLPVIAGVGFATYGDYYFTAWGLFLTLLGTFLAALKTVVTNLIQTGGGGRLKLHPLDLLMRMSPLAFIQCVVYGWYTGELERVRRYGATQMTRGKAIALLINGIIACGLNIVSFTANKKAGALTMTVSANCKQVLTIALAVVLFDLHINPTNAIGILLTLIGGGWYGYIEYIERQQKRVPSLGSKS